MPGSAPASAATQHAQISTAYVFELFPRKEDLFVAALRHGSVPIETALLRGTDGCQ